MNLSPTITPLKKSVVTEREQLCKIRLFSCIYLPWGGLLTTKVYEEFSRDEKLSAACAGFRQSIEMIEIKPRTLRSEGSCHRVDSRTK